MPLWCSPPGPGGGRPGAGKSAEPRGGQTVGVVPLAKRLDGLEGKTEGKTVAQLWDYVFRGDEVFPILQASTVHPLSKLQTPE